MTVVLWDGGAVPECSADCCSADANDGTAMGWRSQRLFGSLDCCCVIELGRWSLAGTARSQEFPEAPKVLNPQFPKWFRVAVAPLFSCLLFWSRLRFCARAFFILS